MKQYTLKEITAMSFAALGAIEDPIALMACGSPAPIVVRYAVRTGQLDTRYPNLTPHALLDAIFLAAGRLPMPAKVGQLVTHGKKNADVDEYLDSLQPHVREVLRGGFKLTNQDSDQVLQFGKTELLEHDLRMAELPPVERYRAVKDGAVVDVLEFGGVDILTVDEGGTVTKWTTAGQPDRSHRPVQVHKITDPHSSMQIVSQLSLALHYVPRR